MRRKLVQVPPLPWPGGYGEIIAMIDVPIESLVARYSLDLFAGSDNLGDYHAAMVELPSGRRVGFVRHKGDPEPGTEVHADVQDDSQEAVRELLEVLGLPESTASWIRDALAVQTVVLPAQAR